MYQIVNAANIAKGASNARPMDRAMGRTGTAAWRGVLPRPGGNDVDVDVDEDKDADEDDSVMKAVPHTGQRAFR